MTSVAAGPQQTAPLPASGRGEPPAGRFRALSGPLTAMALFAALRLFNIVVLLCYARSDENRPGWRELLVSWDAIWYAGIAENGYDTAVSLSDKGTPELSNLVFFPLYPALTAAVEFVLPIHVTSALLLVAWASGLAAAAVLYALGAHLRDRTTGILLAALWAVVPHSVVQSMGYTEPLFTALAAGALLAVLRRNWVAAGVLCLLAGLTRPTAAALVAAVGLAALVAAVREPRRWQPWCAMVLAPLGLIGYMVWVGFRLGRADGYFYVQNEAWKMGFDGGGYTLTTFSELLMEKGSSLEMAEVSLVMLLAVLLLIVAVGERLPWPLLVYAGACVVIALTGDWFYWAKARMLIPAFPLLLPIAYAIRRSRNRTVPAVVVGGMALFAAFTSVYFTLAWNHSF